MPVKVTALGTGTCHGLDHRAPPLFHIRWGREPEQHLIFELTAGFRHRIARAFPLEDPALSLNVHIAVSHVHEDHFGGAMSFKLARHCARAAAKQADAGRVMIYGPRQLSTALEHLHAAHLPERNTETLALAGFETHHAEDGQPIHIADAVLRQYHLFHADATVEAVGFRLELPNGKVIAYTGDAAWPHEEVFDQDSPDLKRAEGVCHISKDADILICDAGGPPPYLVSCRHFNAVEAGAMAQESNVKLLALTHYTGADAPESMISYANTDFRARDRIHVLTDGDTLELP